MNCNEEHRGHCWKCWKIVIALASIISLFFTVHFPIIFCPYHDCVPHVVFFFQSEEAGTPSLRLEKVLSNELPSSLSSSSFDRLTLGTETTGAKKVPFIPPLFHQR